MINFANMKRLLALTADKYKGSKSKTFNIQLHQIITEFYLNRSLSLEQILDILIDLIEKSKNLNARIGMLEWLATEYAQLAGK